MKHGLLTALLLAPLAWAQTAAELADPSARIEAERAQLQAERSAAARTHDERQRDSCLQQVRRDRHAALDPLRARELALNEQERAWRTQQREQRLREKDERGATQP